MRWSSHSTLVLFGTLVSLVAALLAGCPQTTPVSIKIVAFGDSLTEGGSDQSGYVYDLAKALGASLDVQAVGGTRIDSQYEKVMNASLDGVDLSVLLLGYNDMRFNGTDTSALNHFRDRVRAMFTRLTRHTNVLIGTTLRMSDYSSWAPYDKGSDAAARLYSEAIKTVASEFSNVVVADVNGAFPPHPHLYRDGVHPTNEGDLLLCSLFLEAYRLLIKRPLEQADCSRASRK